MVLQRQRRDGAADRASAAVDRQAGRQAGGTVGLAADDAHDRAEQALVLGQRDGEALALVGLEGGQQAAPAVGGQRRRFDRTGPGLQRPVAAQRAGAGGVDRSGHIRAAERLRQRLHRRLAALALAEVAAVDQQVGARGQMGADLGQQRALRVEAGGQRIEHAGTEVEAATAAMREEVQRGHILAPGERVADLRQAVAGRVEHHHLDLRPQAGGQPLCILERRGHEGDLRRAGGWRGDFGGGRVQGGQQRFVGGQARRRRRSRLCRQHLFGGEQGCRVEHDPWLEPPAHDGRGGHDRSVRAAAALQAGGATLLRNPGHCGTSATSAACGPGKAASTGCIGGRAANLSGGFPVRIRVFPGPQALRIPPFLQRRPSAA
ncbi:hypothetical protein MASR2M32_09740 [Sphaerotilus sulfidivorans]